MTRKRKSLSAGLSLLELMAVVAIIGILAVIIVPRFSSHASHAKGNACQVNQGNIEVQCQLWFRQKGAAPQSNLTDIGGDKDYFPEGLPVCPIDGSSYSINAGTLKVTGHTH